MRLSRFFIDRPIFAAVIAVIITVVGALAFVGLPISQYPDIVPPTVTVSAQYPGLRPKPWRPLSPPDRAGNQRRRQHALHEQPVDR
jgi:Cu/Ag efflux pump CusA